ncbi:hypothetical protein C8R43DRAFT_358549 [Mycena crocata]|nr:hypothetical protein C8R43DRAFT_358549 [Mycena crocata]
MQEPKSGGECDFGMCPLQDYDSDENASTREPLMRCSMCKNRFYCSAKCQKKDWKEHKWNCSVFPSADGFPAATVIEIDDEFQAEVKRVVGILKEVADTLKDEKKLSAPMLAPLPKITSELPEHLRYARAIQDSDEFKYRLPIVAACRLLLIDYISTLDETDRKRYEEFFTSMELPMDCCEMYGPKIVGRPADLSPGEYAMISQVMPMWIISQIGTVKAERKEQMGEEAVEGDVEERKKGMQWVWLAVMSKKAYSAKSKPAVSSAST